MPQNTFRSRLKQACVASCLKDHEIAQRSGYSMSYINQLRYTDRSVPTTACVEALAETLKVEPAWLAGWE